MSLTVFQYNIVSYLLLLPVLLNLYQWKSPIVAAIFGGVFILFQAILWGQNIAKKRPALFQIMHGLLLVLIVIIVLGTVIYYLMGLSDGALSIMFLLLPLIGSTILLKFSHKDQGELDLSYFDWPSLRKQSKSLILVGFYLILMITLLTQIISSRTTEAITSPWAVLPASFWSIYIISTIILILILWKTSSKLISYLVTAFHLFVTLSISVFVYKLGYGFDPFIHQAAEEFIAANGEILPKTPYYIGQYALIVTLNKIVGFPLIWLNKLLLPVLAAVSIPLYWLEFTRPSTGQKSFLPNPIWLSLTLILIPFSSFIVTTPQGLANLFFIWIIILSFPLLSNADRPMPLWFLWLIAIASVLIHPLAGIPALIFMTFLSYELYRDRMKLGEITHRILLFIAFILGSISTSLVFLFNGYISPQFSAKLLKFSEVDFTALFSWFPLKIFLSEHQFRSSFFEFGYFIQENIWWMLTIIALIMVYWLANRAKYSYLRVYVLTAAILIINAILLSTFLQFPDIIQYENQNYAARLFHIAFWALLPLLALALIWVYRKTNKSTLFLWVFILFLTWGITGSLFSSYPRNNRYELGRSYSVSQADIAVVQKIGLKKSPFVVLSNQSVSAAAIKEFGFKTYYPTEDGQQLFYYPIPTSSPLYDIYLDMVYDTPSREHAQRAAELVDVTTVHLVINDYWDNSETIIEQAKLQANDWITIEEGKSIIFVYDFGG